ncbi:hypothetical protein BC829DRAFT_436301 [Chytridium lagenaria]|nr:hypothetical protein BC829DRAFT_436301 [Chytridium lagenaria]
MHALSIFIGLLALSAPISGLSVSATRQEFINNDALLTDAASSINNFASSLGSDDFTLDAATSMEFLSDVADFVSLGSQQISALQAHPFVKASPYSHASLREAEMIFDELASDIASEYQGLASDDLTTNEVASKLRRQKSRQRRGLFTQKLKEVKAAVHKKAGEVATKVGKKLGVTSHDVSKWAGRVGVAAAAVGAIPAAAALAAPVAAAAGLAKALADRRIRKKAGPDDGQFPAKDGHDEQVETFRIFCSSSLFL